MLLKPEIRNMLKEQITVELTNMAFYRQCGLVLDNAGWFGSAKWFLKQSSEEQEHSDTIAKYFLDRSRDADLGVTFYSHVIVPDLPETVLLSMFQAVYVAELANTERLLGIYEAAMMTMDFQTTSFLHSFIIEQSNSEAEITTLLARLETMTGDRAALEAFDQSLVID
jgi:ferritin